MSIEGGQPRPYRRRAIFSISTPLVWVLFTFITWKAIQWFGNAALGTLLLAFMLLALPAMIWLGAVITCIGMAVAVQLAREVGPARKWGLVGMILNGTMIALGAIAWAYDKLQHLHK